MGPIWGRQDPGGPYGGPMNLAIWVLIIHILSANTVQCHYNMISFYSNLLLGELWGVYCEVQIWYTCCHCHHSTVCNIMMNWTMLWYRGVARRRPQGPGLNLKMLKKITIHKPRSFLQEIPYCHVEHCLFKSLLLARLRSPDTKFTYLCLYM